MHGVWQRQTAAIALAAQREHTKSAPVLSTRPQESPILAAHILQRMTIPHPVSSASRPILEGGVRVAPAAPKKKGKK